MKKLPEFRIYRNLHKNCFSVTRRNQNGTGYRLHEHVTDLTAHGVEFRVSKHGRKKVLESKQKNVHAFVYCENYTTFVNEHQLGDQVYYNPYQMETFQVRTTGEPIHNAGTLIMTNNKCYLNG
jgi:hypothetical protein